MASRRWWAAVVGVFTDYWTGTPPAFWAVAVGTLFLMAGFAFLGVSTLRSADVPRWTSLVMIGAGVGSPLVIFLLPHIPSGFLLLFHAAWIAIGYLLWWGEGEQAQRIR